MPLFHSQEYFNKAIEVLKLQIDGYERSKEFSLNLEFFLQKYNITIFDDETKSKNYFDNKIQNQLFYGLKDEFFIYNYPVPKGISGIRNYVFISYPLAIVYYAISLYLLDISEQIFEIEKQVLKKYLEETGSSYSHSSGNLIQNINLKKEISKDAINHNKHYKNIINKIKKQSKPTENKTYIIKFDIQNFFEDIEIERILDFIGSNIKNFQEKELNIKRKRDILDFFHYLNSGKGVIQSDKNLASNSLADLYLMKFDFSLIDYLRANSIKFDYCRYADDSYLIIHTDDINYEKFIYRDILPQIEEILFNELSLRLNSNKTKVWKLENESEWTCFIRDLKNISQVDENPEVDENESTPFKERGLIFLEKTNKLEDEIFEHKEDGTIMIKKLGYNFNEIFTKDDGGNNLLDWIKTYQFNESNLETLDTDIFTAIQLYPNNLKEAFIGFNYQNINLASKAFLAIIYSNTDIKTDFLQFYDNKSKWTIFDMFLVSRELSSNHTYFNLHKNKIPINYTFLKKFYDNKNILTDDISHPIYRKYKDKDDLCEQIKLREITENLKDYSRAFNHLLNEFHLICYYQSGYTGDIKNFKQPELIKSIIKNFQQLKIDEMRIIIDFFERRNKNNISHSGGINISYYEFIHFKNFIETLYRRYLHTIRT